MARTALMRHAATLGRRFSRPLLDPSKASRRVKSSVAISVYEDSDVSEDKSRNADIRRLSRLRNVGILAHIDAGKTSCTERMLALAGIVRRVGSVDEGNTVTDYLPAERERGITIQSAAISFEWKWHHSLTGDDFHANDNVQIHLIDTPGHVDFSVEVNRSVAVLDGAVLVVDAVAGVQAQTETVWRAMTRPSRNNHNSSKHSVVERREYSHEPLPCIAMINKMDKEGCHFENSVASLRNKLPGCNPLPIQMPLFQTTVGRTDCTLGHLDRNVVSGKADDMNEVVGEFVGLVDLVHMRAIVWPEVSDISNVDQCIPRIISLLGIDTHLPLDPACRVTSNAITARAQLVESLADVDEAIAEYFLNEEEPPNAELREALRRATLSRQVVPVLAGTALKGRGIELLLDSVADFLPSPLDRMPPALARLDETTCVYGRTGTKHNDGLRSSQDLPFGHPLHPSLLAFAFKVVHMKGRGGSGDGRVVFARVYSGQLQDRAALQVISPPALGETPGKPRTERVGGMLELAGGQFDNLDGGMCKSGDVCALVGLKSVVTGDTIMLAPEGPKGKKGKKKAPAKLKETLYLAGVASPKPVLTVRLEAESSEMQTKLSNSLRLLSIEDPSLVVEETDSVTLLSGLGELHIEVSLDRVYRESGIRVMTGAPAVAYRETVSTGIESQGLVEYDRTIGSVRLQGSVHLRLEPVGCEGPVESSCVALSDPLITLGTDARLFLNVDEEAREEDIAQYNELVKALVQGCEGALKRGLRGYPVANVRCRVVNVDAEGGLPALQGLPGALRAAAANAVLSTLSSNRTNCTVLEPIMSVEITLPGDQVGSVLADLTCRRGSVGDVIIGEDEGVASTASRALVHGEVPLVEILGYAGSLRSLTGGEAAFSAEYAGHSPCDESVLIR